MFDRIKMDDIDNLTNCIGLINCRYIPWHDIMNTSTQGGVNYKWIKLKKQQINPRGYTEKFLTWYNCSINIGGNWTRDIGNISEELFHYWYS